MPISHNAIPLFSMTLFCFLSFCVSLVLFYYLLDDQIIQKGVTGIQATMNLQISNLRHLLSFHFLFFD